MDYVALALGLALPWLLGIGVLLAIDWPGAKLDHGGRAALCAGYAYFAGVLLLTLWMKVLSKVGVPFSRASIGGPLLILMLALFIYHVRSGRLSLSGASNAIMALVRPPLADWQRVAWLLIVAWLALLCCRSPCHLLSPV